MLGVGDVLEWCGPVRVDYPGVPIDVAAEVLGRHVETVRRWLPVKQQRRGWRLDPWAVVPIGRDDGRPKAKDVAEWRAGKGIALNVDYEVREEQAAGKTGAGQRMGWGVRYERPAVHGRHSGGAVPVVWCRRAIDPGHQGGVRPHPAWGSGWEGLAKRYAEMAAASGIGEHDNVLVAERVPRWRDRTIRRAGELDEDAEVRREFRGWEWVCPGMGGEGCGEPGGVRPDRGDTPRLAGGGDEAVRHGGGCGRRVSGLVCPLPEWSVAAYLADRAEVRDGLEVGEAERWRPGVGPEVDGGLRFACAECWKVRSGAMNGARQWNEFVGRMSGGLLYGKDVARPAGW